MTSYNYFFIVRMFPMQVFPRGSFSTWCIFVVSTFGWSTWSSASSRPPSRRSCRTRRPRTSFFPFWRKCQSRSAQIRPILVRHLKTNILWFHKLLTELNQCRNRQVSIRGSYMVDPKMDLKINFFLLILQKFASFCKRYDLPMKICLKYCELTQESLNSNLFLNSF